MIKKFSKIIIIIVLVLSTFALLFAEENKLVDLRKYRELMKKMYLPEIKVESFNIVKEIGNSSDRDIYQVEINLNMISKQENKKQISSPNKFDDLFKMLPGKSDKGTEIIFKDKSGKAIKSIKVSKIVLDQILSMFKYNESGRTNIILDLKSAGLLKDNAKVNFNLSSNETCKISRLKRLGYDMKMSLRKKPKFERMAYMQLPLMNHDPLLVKVELSPVLTLSPDEPIILKVGDLTISKPIIDFPDTEKLLEKLFDEYGEPKEISISMANIKLVDIPSQVEIAKSGWNILVLALDDNENVIGMKKVNIPVNLNIVVPGEYCGERIEISPYYENIKDGIQIVIDKITDFEANSIKSIKIIDLDSYDIMLRYIDKDFCKQ